ncbi:MAG: ATP-binding cassette subfamily F protein uup [Limisphaerales bacterium]|jgi:ATP-binding cassette subfamily F protein uup
MIPLGTEIISANDLSLSHGFDQLLDSVSLSILSGDRIGLVGRNGCGKTSFLKLLTGSEEPDGGVVSVRKSVRMGYLPQEFELDGTKTVRENIELGAADVMEWRTRYESGDGTDDELAEFQHLIEDADGWQLESRTKAVADALNTPSLDRLVGPLSGGEMRRVALCRAIVAQPDLLLLDEPTNHLDADSIQWLEDYLKTFKGALIFVTHDRYFLDVLATRMWELDGGKVFSHSGNYTDYLEAKAVRQQIAEQGERRRQRFLRVELDWVKAGVRAQRSKSKHRLDTFYETQGLEAPPEERDMDLLIPPATELGHRGFELVNAGIKVGEGDEERWLFRNLDLDLGRGTCTGIVGRNGVGKTTLLRACIGDQIPQEGSVKIGSKVDVNYIDQSRMKLDLQATVMQEISADDEQIVFGDRKLSTRAYLKRYLFADDRMGQRVEMLSGGERARLLLAKILKNGGNVLVLDEPTNDLDLPSLRMLEEALSAFDGIVLVVSHDRYFLDRICDQIVAFEDDGVHVQPGNFSYYLEKRKEREQRRRQQNAFQAGDLSRQPAKPTPKPAATRKLSYKEQQEFAGMEGVILKKEDRVAELETTLGDPEFYSKRANDAATVNAEMEALKLEVARLYARWEALEKLKG